jgi:hypothetical protein
MRRRTTTDTVLSCSYGVAFHVYLLQYHVGRASSDLAGLGTCRFKLTSDSRSPQSQASGFTAHSCDVRSAHCTPLITRHLPHG